MNNFNEPPVDPLADTSPSIAIRPDALRKRGATSRWRRIAGLLSLLGAAVFTVATVLVVLTPPADNGQPIPPTQNIAVQPTATTETVPTDVPPTVDSAAQTTAVDTTNEMALTDNQAAALLLTPMAQAPDDGDTVLVRANMLDPFTLIPDRPRTEVIVYSAVKGDTINSIAQRFGLKPETIAWSNPRKYIEVLYPGDPVNILPVDGVYYTAVGNHTIADVAKMFKIDDPYLIIDSEYNNLTGLTPDSVLPSNTRVVIPGGQAEDISWHAPVQTDSSGYVVSFARGQSGSCGNVNPSGGTYWGNPLPNGTWVRGFIPGVHTGIDLAAAVGTPIHAANGGPVVYSGWNSWGYGNTVVLAHGPYTTLYGHMIRTNVSCGQFVNTGDVIGFVGSTGNSTGPHLHFEIRYLDQPTDPTTVPGIGW